MRSTWHILVGIAIIGAAAVWYDAKNEVASAPPPSAPAVVTAEAKLPH